MSGLQPVQLYASRIPPGDFLIPAVPKHAATGSISLTMASIDPTEEPSELTDASQIRRSTLKVIRLPFDVDSDSEDSEDDEDLSELEDDEDSDAEVNGGPSDLSKMSSKSKKAALLKALANDEDDDMADGDEDLEGGKKGISEIAKAIQAVKGKDKALDSEDDSELDDEDEDSLPFEPDEVVVCTLDPTQHYQQALNITVGADEQVFFKVSGTHTVHLTGNYVIPAYGEPGYDDEEDDDEYDLSPNEDELDGLDALIGGDSESDELDDLDDPRIAEIDSEEEEKPKVIKAAKNSKKRSAPSDDSEEEPSMDLEKTLAEQVQNELAAKALKKEDVKSEPATNGDTKKLSKAEKKRQKKLKNNEGEAAAAPATTPTTDTKSTKKEPLTNGTASAEKKVQFATNLEQGPTATSTKQPESKTTLTNIQGIKIDVREEGSGPAAKKNSKIEMRYIGKLANGKVFDSNKSGKPFSFTLGKGEVIKGWDLGLEGIKVGGQRRLTIPAKHAYGNQSLPGIPKGSELTFDVKCLTVK